MIKFQHITKHYDGATVLDDVSFSVSPGERLSLIGPGGCGKTTVLKLLLGLERPNVGNAFLFNTDMSFGSDADKELVYQRVGMAFQQGGLFDFMTVRENMMFAMEHMTRKTESEMETELKRLLAGVKLPGTADMFPHELSGGMKRRVGIARALCTGAEVAIFDEPTAGLDPVTSTIILQMILELGGANSKTSMLVATSNVEIAIRFADRLLILRDGKVEADGSWRELLISGSDWVRNFLSVRLIGLDIEYARGLDLPQAFLAKHWQEVART